MDKQRYLAELRRLLVYMSEDDKELTVRRVSEHFEAVGPDGEEELIAYLGSPTKVAIGLSRGYVEGEVEGILPRLPSHMRPEREALPGGAALPDFSLPGAGESGAGAQREPDAFDELFAAERERDGESAPPPEEPPPEKEEETGDNVPLWLGIPLFALVMIALGLPLGLLLAALVVVLLLPGLACLVGVYLIGVAGLWSVSFMADAIMLFGLAFIALALGLLVLWAGVWLGVKLIALYARGVRWLSGELLGRRSREDE